MHNDDRVVLERSLLFSTLQLSCPESLEGVGLTTNHNCLIYKFSDISGLTSSAQLCTYYCTQWQFILSRISQLTNCDTSQLINNINNNVKHSTADGYEKCFFASCCGKSQKYEFHICTLWSHVTAEIHRTCNWETGWWCLFGEKYTTIGCIMSSNFF